MTDEIKKRLEDTTEQCVKAYGEWRKDEKNDTAREALQEAVHEVRKVASRLEIELVTSKRDNTVKRPMTAPSHRSSRGPQQVPEKAPDGNKNTEKAKAFEKLKKKTPPKDAPKEESKEA